MPSGTADMFSNDFALMFYFSLFINGTFTVIDLERITYSKKWFYSFVIKDFCERTKNTVLNIESFFFRDH
jgi:hypothetical protein